MFRCGFYAFLYCLNLNFYIGLLKKYVKCPNCAYSRTYFEAAISVSLHLPGSFLRPFEVFMVNEKGLVNKYSIVRQEFTVRSLKV